MKIVKAIAIIATLGLSGCGAGTPSWKPTQARKYYPAQMRQTAPEPVYNRLRTTHLPEPLPSRNLPGDAEVVYQPTVHFDLKNGTLAEASEMLAKTVNYGSYTSPLIADRRVTINSVGDLEEISKQLEIQANVQVLIDHDQRVVRVMPIAGVTPKFAGAAAGS